MGGALSIRRLRLTALAPHDHPSPSELEDRLVSAARTGLARELEGQLRFRKRHSVLRIRRLKLDITLDVGASDSAFATHLAAAISSALHRAERQEDPADQDNVVIFDTPALYLAALIEALAARRATECWWLSDTEGLLYLKPAAAIRTALLAEPLLGQAALLSLKPQRRIAVLSVLGNREAARVLDAFAAAAQDLSNTDACAAAIAAAVAQNPAATSPLALYLTAVGATGLGGASLAAAAYVAASVLVESPIRLTTHSLSTVLQEGSPLAQTAQQAKVALAALSTESVLRDCEVQPQYSRFAGLLLLVPSLEFAALGAQVSARSDAADAAALIAFAALGACAGRKNFPAWLRDPVWRALFGIDPRVTAAAVAERLSDMSLDLWQSLASLGNPPATLRELKFLLPPRLLFNPDPHAANAAVLTIAGLANAIAARFARRLSGMRSASAPFLWENVLGAGGVFEQHGDGRNARLTRPPLDVLVSLSRLADGSVQLPGGSVGLTRATT